MAHLMATNLSLGLPYCSKQGDDTEDDVSKPELWRWPEITPAASDDVIVKENGGRPYYAQERGKRNHPTGLVDYLGALPVLKTHLPMQELSNIEAKTLLSSVCRAAPVMIPRADLSYMSQPPTANHARCIPANSPASLSAQLTLFYAGTVSVYDNVPADKAQVIMSLAGSCNPWPVKELNSSSRQALNAPDMVSSSFKRPVAPSPQPPVPRSLQAHHLLQKIQSNMQGSPLTATNLSASDSFQVPDDGQTQELSSLLVPCEAVVPKALPIARKESLARFLEKRKERVRSMAPYSVKENCQDFSHQRKNHFNANTPSVFYSGLLGSHGEKKLGSNFRFLDNDGVSFEMDGEDQNWLTIAKNSKQVSECESAT